MSGIKVGDRVRFKREHYNYSDQWLRGIREFEVEHIDQDGYLWANEFGSAICCYPFHVHKVEETPTGPQKSDGGSSSYYDLAIPQSLLERLVERSEQGECFIKTEEIITHFFGNDFDYGNIFKSLVRSYGLEAGTGGKAGNSVDYEMNKIQYSSNKIKEKNKE